MKIQLEQLDLLHAWPRFTLRDGYYAMAILVRLGQVPIGEVMVRPARKRVVAHHRLRRRITRTLGEALLKHLMRDRLSVGAGGLTPSTLQEFLSPAGVPAPMRDAIIESQSRTEHAAPPVTIAICSSDRAPAVESCIAHLNTLDYPEFEIMIVDSSADPVPTREIADRLDILYVRCQRRGGVSRARNTALQHARTEWVAFLDADARPERNWLRELTRPAQDPHCRCVCGLVLPDKIENAAEVALHQHDSAARRYTQAVYDRRFLKARVLHAPPTWQIGSGENVLLNTFFAEDIGAYDVDLGTSAQSGACGGEDADLFYRVLRTGKTVHYVPQAIVYDQRRWTPRIVRNYLRAYALGHAAYHLRSFIKRGDYRSLLHIAWFHPIALARQLKQSLTLRSRYPFSLAALELRATLTGPWRYTVRKLRGGLKKLFGAQHGALRPVTRTAPIDIPPKHSPARPQVRSNTSRAA